MHVCVYTVVIWNYKVILKRWGLTEDQQSRQKRERIGGNTHTLFLWSSVRIPGVWGALKGWSACFSSAGVWPLASVSVSVCYPVCSSLYMWLFQVQCECVCSSQGSWHKVKLTLSNLTVWLGEVSKGHSQSEAARGWNGPSPPPHCPQPHLTIRLRNFSSDGAREHPSGS